MSSLDEGEVLQHVHSMAVEYCLLNNSSHALINAMTRDIYPTKNAQEKDEFALNIKECSTTFHYKYSQNIHIVHFSQLKWLSTLQQRPDAMLPNAHHLIVFFNHINIENIDIQHTQSILEEFIIQCLISMDPSDVLAWNEYLDRYCQPFDFCKNYARLLSLSGKTKQSKEFRDFCRKHAWKLFTATMSEWCLNVMNALQLSRNKSLLYRLAKCMNNNIQTDKTQTDDDNINIMSEEQQIENKEEILDITDNMDINDDDHGLAVMSLSMEPQIAPNEMEDVAANNNECNHAIISDYNLHSAAPQSMPSLEMDSQQMQSVQTTMEDDYGEEGDEQLLSDLAHINADSDQTGLLPLRNDNNNENKNGSQQSNESNESNGSEILLQSQMQSDNNNMDEDDEYPIPSQPIRDQKGFSFPFQTNIRGTDLLPQNDEEMSETESPPSPPPNDSVLPSQIPTAMPIDMDCDDVKQQNKNEHSSPLASDCLTQNYNNILSQNRRGKKRSFDEMQESQSSQERAIAAKRARISPDANISAKQERKIKSDWPIWMKKEMEVTVELEEELLCAIIRKVSAQFVLVKIMDDEAPQKYRNKQFKIYIKDKDKIEPVFDYDDNNNNDNAPRNDNDNVDVFNNNNNGQISEMDQAIIWQMETEGNNGDIASPLEPSQDVTNKNELKSVLKKTNDDSESNNKRVQWQLTSSQEHKEKAKLTNRPLRAGGIHSVNNNLFAVADNDENGNGVEVEWSDIDEDESEIGNASIFERFEPMETNSSLMPKRITNKELIKNPMKFCGFKRNENNNRNIRNKLNGNKKKRKRSAKVAWNDAEIGAVIEGYAKYKQYENVPIGKPGIWAYTMRDIKLGKILSKNNRSNQNLCDKWRHLNDKNDHRIQHLIGTNIKNEKVSPKKKMPKLPTKPIP